MLQNLYSNAVLFFYPLQALSTKAKKDKRLFASPHTWRKYIKLLKLRRPIIIMKPKKAYPIGIQTRSSHELWHIDVTEIKIKKEKTYLQVILDNYSRAILSFQFIDSIVATNTLTLIETTIKKYGTPLKIMSDAGKENLNKYVKCYLENVKVNHSISKVNTRYFNSKVEVFFRMMKSNFLCHLKINSKKELKHKINFYIHNYNYEIPHSALNYRTPDEVLKELSSDHYSKLFVKYQKEILKQRMSQYKKKAPFGA